MLINILGKTASDYFSPTVALLSVKLKLGHNLAGVTLLAFANGAPDVFSSISGLTSGENSDISMGSLLGGAFFVTTVVVGTIGLLSPCEFAKADFTRDVAFLLVALTIVLVTANIGYVSVLTVVTLFLVYIAYIAVVVITPLLEARLTGVDGPEVDAGSSLTGYNIIQNVQTAFWFHSNIASSGASIKSGISDRGLSAGRLSTFNSKRSSPYNGVAGAATAATTTATTLPAATSVKKETTAMDSGYKFVILADEEGDEEKGPALGDDANKVKDIRDVDEDGKEVINLSGSVISPIFSAKIIEEHFDGAHAPTTDQDTGDDYNGDFPKPSSEKRPLSRTELFEREMRRLEAIAEGATPAKLSERFRGLREKFVQGAKEVRSKLSASLTESLLQPEDGDFVAAPAVASDEGLPASQRSSGASSYDKSRSSLVYSLYWQPALLRRRLMKRLEASDWKEYSPPMKVLTALEFPLVLLRDITIPTVDAKLWFKPYAMLQPICAPLFFLLTTGNIHSKVGAMPLALLLELVGFAASFLVFVYTHHGKPPRNRAFTYAWLSFAFLMCINWIYVIAGELVACLASIGRIFKIPPAYLGLTVLAWGNSVGDFFSNISVAQRGLGEMAVGGCFGGPLFNILIGFGLPMAYLTARSYPKPYEIPIDGSAIISVVFFYFSLISLLIISNYTGFRLTKPLGIYLITLYIVYTFVQAAFVASEV
jgi:Ca2+/Na+ antiporter